MEGLEKAVVDASVVVKWFNQEEFTEEALLLRQRIRRGTVTPFAPELMIFEVANSLRYNPDFGAVDVQQAVRSLRDMQFPAAPMDEDMWRRAVDIAFERGITIYDSAYVAMSECMDAKLYTADARLAKKTMGMGRVVHISGYK